jgi:hypothetical protein
MALMTPGNFGSKPAIPQSRSPIGAGGNAANGTSSTPRSPVSSPFNNARKQSAYAAGGGSATGTAAGRAVGPVNDPKAQKAKLNSLILSYMDKFKEAGLNANEAMHRVARQMITAGLAADLVNGVKMVEKAYGNVPNTPQTASSVYDHPSPTPTAPVPTQSTPPPSQGGSVSDYPQMRDNPPLVDVGYLPPSPNDRMEEHFTADQSAGARYFPPGSYAETPPAPGIRRDLSGLVGGAANAVKRGGEGIADTVDWMGRKIMAGGEAVAKSPQYLDMSGLLTAVPAAVDFVNKHRPTQKNWDDLQSYITR